jgi:preprotein translocase subunit SecE
MDVVNKIREFFHDVVVEFRRVSWPNRREVVGSTTVVIVMTVLLAVFLAGVDNVLSWIVTMILR